MNLADLKESGKTAACILAGNAVLAFVVDAFILPHGIIMGGTTGIALLIHRFFQIPTALFVFAINSVILLLGLILLGKKLFFTSMASTALYPLFLALFEHVPAITSLTDNTLLAALFAGTLMGIALGLVMRVGSSTGGTDITNLILSKYTHKPVAVFVYVSDIVIVGAQALITDFQSILLGIVVLVLESLLLNRVMVSGTSQIQLIVISEHVPLIKQRFLNELQAGVTLWHIQTGMRQTEQHAVMCIIPPRKLYAATSIISQTDANAFITITKIKEVRGKGFTIRR